MGEGDVQSTLEVLRSRHAAGLPPPPPDPGELAEALREAAEVARITATMVPPQFGNRGGLVGRLELLAKRFLGRLLRPLVWAQVEHNKALALCAAAVAEHERLLRQVLNENRGELLAYERRLQRLLEEAGEGLADARDGEHRERVLRLAEVDVRLRQLEVGLAEVFQVADRARRGALHRLDAVEARLEAAAPAFAVHTTAVDGHSPGRREEPGR